jgi:hypothetical protein
MEVLSSSWRRVVSRTHCSLPFSTSWRPRGVVKMRTALAWAVNDIELRAGHLCTGCWYLDLCRAELGGGRACRGSRGPGGWRRDVRARSPTHICRSRSAQAAIPRQRSGGGRRATGDRVRTDLRGRSGPNGPMSELASSLRADPRTMIELLGTLAKRGRRCAWQFSILCKRALGPPVGRREAPAAHSSTPAAPPEPSVAATLGSSQWRCSVGQTEMWIGDVTPGLLNEALNSRKGRTRTRPAQSRSSARPVARTSGRPNDLSDLRGSRRRLTARGDERGRVLTL